MVLKRPIDHRLSNPRVSIMDLEAGDDSTRGALLECATRQDLFEDVFVWSATLPKESVNALSSAGFEPAVQGDSMPDDRKVLVRQTDGTRLTEDWHIDGVRILDGANWDMRMIYSMAG